jgi:hypothetical protein
MPEGAISRQEVGIQRPGVVVPRADIVGGSREVAGRRAEILV